MTFFFRPSPQTRAEHSKARATEKGNSPQWMPFTCRHNRLTFPVVPFGGAHWCHFFLVFLLATFYLLKFFFLSEGGIKNRGWRKGKKKWQVKGRVRYSPHLEFWKVMNVWLACSNIGSPKPTQVDEQWIFSTWRLCLHVYKLHCLHHLSYNLSRGTKGEWLYTLKKNLLNPWVLLV